MKELSNSRVCIKCGTTLSDNQIYCHQCGYKVPKYNNKFSKKNKLLFVAVFSLLVLLLLGISIFCFKYVLPHMFVTVDELVAQGKYEEAYQKASNNEKEDILIENTIAYLSNETSKLLRNPDSFVLEEAYYHIGKINNLDSEQQVVLHVTGTNGLGAVTSVDWIWSYNSKTQKWEYLWSSDFYYSSLDNYEQEMIINNMYYEIFSDIVSNDNKEITNSMVNNINSLFQNGYLDNIELLKN